MGEDKWLTVKGAAERGQCCVNTVRKFALSGELKGGRVGNRWRFLASDVDEFIAARTWKKGEKEPK